MANKASFDAASAVAAVPAMTPWVRLGGGVACLIAGPALAYKVAMAAMDQIPSWKDLSGVMAEGYLVDASNDLALVWMAVRLGELIAFIYFCYEVVRIGERLLVPFNVLEPERFVGIVRPVERAAGRIAKFGRAVRSEDDS